jgi:crotonobetainyl-CoA:carnitine CoA-transferase CaiB-like acyl-CoA transferase
VLSAPASLATTYATESQRLAQPDTLDAELCALTDGLDVHDLVRRLQAAGVPAGKSATAVDVIADDRLWSRGSFRFVSDHLEGLRPVLGASWVMSTDEAQIDTGAPDLGEHDAYVFGEVLGSSYRSG